MKLVIYSLTLLTLFLAACGNQAENKATKSFKYSDYSYRLVEKGDGVAPIPGQYTKYSIRVSGNNGRVILEKNTEDEYGYYKVLIDTVSLGKNPVNELLNTLSKGDSAVFEYALDSIEKANPAIAGMDTIIYEVAILDVISEEDMQAIREQKQQEQEAKIEASSEKGEQVAKRLEEVLAAYKNNELADRLKTTESGLEYVVEVEGEGDIPKEGDFVFVHYYGILESNGEMFDNSYQRGDYFSFPLGQGRVIEGWDEALSIIPQGTEAIFFIPYQLAYGAAGRAPRIPEKAKLVFYIEYVK